VRYTPSAVVRAKLALALVEWCPARWPSQHRQLVALPARVFQSRIAERSSRIVLVGSRGAPSNARSPAANHQRDGRRSPEPPFRSALHATRDAVVAPR